jgi:hypothetical protein
MNGAGLHAEAGRRYHPGMNDLAWIEGEIVPAREAKVPLNDRGLMFAEAAYEVCVGRGGRIFAWPEHKRRLERTLAGIQMPEAAAAVDRTEKAVRELVLAFGGGMFLLYLEVTGGVAPRLHVLPRDPSPAVYATIRPHERANLAREQERGIVAIVTPDVRWTGPRSSFRTSSRRSRRARPARTTSSLSRTTASSSRAPRPTSSGSRTGACARRRSPATSCPGSRARS